MRKWRNNFFRGSKIIAPFVFLLLFIFPLNTSSYFAETTHSQLTREAAQLFNKGPKNLSSQEINYLIKGAVDEDTPPRWLNHFYDPITGKGWSGEGVNGISTDVVKYLSSFGLSYEDIASAKKWAEDPLLQNAYILYQGDQTWQRAITEYVGGNKKEAFIALGHTLHLLEDMTVPDHTRNDTHSGILADPQSFYEVWAKNYTDTNELNLSDSVSPINFNTLGEYFDSLATYSNKNFVSADTISKYSIKISREVNAGPLTYVYTNDGVGEYPIYKYYSDTKDGYSLQDPKILPAYWSRLAPKAVGAGAGVLDLFFKEVEEAKNHPEKYQTPSTPVALALNLSFGRLPLISIFGEVSRINSVVNNTIAFFKNIYSGSRADEAQTSLAPVPAVTIESPLQNSAAPSQPNATSDLIRNPENDADSRPRGNDNANSGDSELQTSPSTLNNLPLSPEAEAERSVTPPTPVPSAVAEAEPAPPVESNQESVVAEPAAATSTVSEFLNPEPPVYVPTPHAPRMGPARVEEPSAPDTVPPETPVILSPTTTANWLTNQNKFFLSGQKSADTTKIVLEIDGVTETLLSFSSGTAWEKDLDLPSGEHKISVTAKDAASNVSAPAEINIVIDQTAPVVSFTNFLSVQKNNAFQIGWQGEDDSGAVAFYDLDWADASTTTLWQPILTQSSSAVADFSGDDKHSYNFRLRASDEAGNVSGWLESGTTTIRVPHVVISEVQIGGKTAGDEFVELYNPGDSSVSISGWKLQKVTGSGKTRENLLASFPAGEIAAHGFYLITHPEDYTGAITPDATYSTKNSLAPNNSVVLYDASENIIDTFGFGDVVEFETAPAVSLDSSGGSFERKASVNSTAETMTSGGDDERMGNAEDTDNNAADFVLRVAGNPQNSESAPEPRDGDEANPGQIIDLRAALTETSATSAKLLWSTPADAKLTGEAIYEVRYISQPLATGCTLNILWSMSARVVPNPVPADAAGSAEALMVNGLSANSYYCFGIKTWNGYRWSDLSNLYVVHTLRTGGSIIDRATYLPDTVKKGTLTLTPEGNPYYVFGNTWIQTGAKLVIEPGVIIKFKPFYFSGIVNIPTALMIDGELVANGTAENPIIFTSERDDRFGGDTDGDNGANPPTPDSWGAVRLGIGGSAAAAIENARFYYGGKTGNNDANLGGALFWQGSRDFVVKDSVFQNNVAGIYAVDTLGRKKNLRIEGSEFSDNSVWNLLNNGANVETINCTPSNP